MSTLEITFGVITAICLVITAVIAWVALYRRSQVDVSFTAEHVHKKDFEKHVDEDHREQSALHSRIGGVERGVESRILSRVEKYESEAKESRRLMHAELQQVSNAVAGLENASDTTQARIVQLDSKIDRLIERSK